MASTQASIRSKPLINRALVNFHPPEYKRIKETLLRRIDVIARAFCESEINMLRVISSGEAQIGTINDYEGSFCIYIEYQGAQVLKPVHVLH